MNINVYNKPAVQVTSIYASLWEQSISITCSKDYKICNLEIKLVGHFIKGVCIIVTYQPTSNFQDCLGPLPDSPFILIWTWIQSEVFIQVWHRNQKNL